MTIRHVVYRHGRSAEFAADYVNRDNGLTYKANVKTAQGAKESMKMAPALLTQHRKTKKDNDDD
jgi:hypothetical protein